MVCRPRRRAPRGPQLAIKVSRVLVDQLTMSVSPGWYSDPSAYGGLRWWDGQQWTAHASPPASTQTYASQQYVPVQPAQRFSTGRVILAVVGFFVLAPVVAAVAIPVFLHRSSSPTCGTEAPSGASNETKAYVSVVHENYRQLAAYTRYVNQHGGNDGHASTPAEYAIYRKSEIDFSDGVAAIPFTGKAAIDAPGVITANRAIVTDLDALISAPTQAAHHRLQGHLASLNAVALRTDLGLTPTGTGCPFWEPG